MSSEEKQVFKDSKSFGKKGWFHVYRKITALWAPLRRLTGEPEDPFEGTAEVESRAYSVWEKFSSHTGARVGLIVLIVCSLFSFIGPWFLPHRVDEVFWGYTLHAPTFERGFILGTDGNGRDLLVRLMYGGRISLSVAFLATFVSIVIGVVYGAISGYLGGRVDSFMMRIVEVLYGLPFVFLVILLVMAFGRSFYLIYIALGAVGWLDMARIVRGQTLSLRNKEFVGAARALGLTSRQIIFRHIIPNTMGTVVIYATLRIPGFIMLESFISFLGLGVQEPLTSLGVLISDGASVLESRSYLIIPPSLLLIAIVLSFNFIGDGLRDALDPKSISK